MYTKKKDIVRDYRENSTSARIWTIARWSICSFLDVFLFFFSSFEERTPVTKVIVNT